MLACGGDTFLRLTCIRGGRFDSGRFGRLTAAVRFTGFVRCFSLLPVKHLLIPEPRTVARCIFA
jgi:hypothetical protein